MLLTYLRPRADLVDYVRAYYYFETPVAAVQPLCAELGNIRVLLSGGGRITTPDGTVTQITDAFLMGPTMGAYSIECEPGTRVFGVGVRPRGWGALMGVDATELTDRVADLTDLAGKIAGDAVDRVCEAASPLAMAHVADSFFSEILDRRLNRACAYPEALEHWLRDPNDLDLDRLMDMMDVSQRQTERLAKQFFGAAPKRLQRKYRTLRAADRIRDGARDWRDAAGAAVYDQAHFIREFKTFIGVTPGQFAANEAELIKAVQARRIVLDRPLPLAAI